MAEVGAALDLAADWLDPGPTSLLDFGLPDGFWSRLEARTYGNLTVRLASRTDHVCFKLHAAVDHWPARSRHFVDLQALGPSPEELRAAASWTRSHDPSEGFHAVLGQVLKAFGVEARDE